MTVYDQLEVTRREIEEAARTVREYQSTRPDQYSVGAVEALKSSGACLDDCHLPPPEPPPPDTGAAECLKAIEDKKREREYLARQARWEAEAAAIEEKKQRALAWIRSELRLQIDNIPTYHGPPPPDAAEVEAQKRAAAVAEYKATEETWRRDSFSNALEVVGHYEKGRLNQREAALWLDHQWSRRKLTVSDWVLARELCGLVAAEEQPS